MGTLSRLERLRAMGPVRHRKRAFLELLLLLVVIQLNSLSLLTMAQLNGRIIVDPNLEVTSLDDTVRTRNLTCTHAAAARVNGEMFAITVKSIEWLLDGQLTATQGPIFHVPASSLQQSGNYTCRINYIYNDGKTHQNVSDTTQEIIIVATLNEAFQLLTPVFVNSALRPPSHKVVTSSNHLVAEGSRFLFNCAATSRLTAPIFYRVYRKDRIVSRSPQFTKVMTLSDAVVWSCDVSNAAGHTKHFFNINVTLATGSGIWSQPTTLSPSSRSLEQSGQHSTSAYPAQLTSPPRRTNRTVYVATVYALGGIIAGLAVLGAFYITRHCQKARGQKHSLDREQEREKEAVPTAAGSSVHRSRLESTSSVRSTNPLLSQQISRAQTMHSGDVPITPIFTDGDTFQFVSETHARSAGFDPCLSPPPVQCKL